MKKKAIILIPIALIVLIGCAVGAKFLLDRKAEEEHAARISSIAQGANEIVVTVRNALKAKSPVTWVYDRDMNLIMTLTSSNALQAVTAVPQEIQQAILQQGNVFSTVASRYFSENPAESVSEETFDGYTQRLQMDFTQDELVQYLATTSNFGVYTGLSAAANNLFGVSVDKLSAAQLAYFAYAYDRSDATLDSYMKVYPDVTVDQLGATTEQTDYRALRSLIMEELQAIPHIDMDTTSYNVQVTLSTSQQTKLQSMIDTEMRQFIELNSDGTYALDCSVLVIDNNGRIRAYVPRRTSNRKSNDVFKLNGLTFSANLVQLISEMQSPDACWLTLREVKTSNGDIVYKSLAELFNSMNLSTDTATDMLSAQDVVEDIYSLNDNYPGFGIIHEVQTLDGDAVFTWPSTRLQDYDILSFTGSEETFNPSHKVYEFFSEDAVAHTLWGFDLPLSTGFVSFHHTSNYTVAIVAGTGTLGATLNQSNKEFLQNFIERIHTTVKADYPTEGKILWPSGMEPLIDTAYSYNASLIKPMYEKLYLNLETIQVTSAETRRQWEAAYKEVTNLIAQYQAYLSPPTVADWMGHVDTLRKATAEALLRYSA